MSTEPLIIGHRGASALAPENTLAAFTRALHTGADGIEFDVRLSYDGVPVVIHDASLARTALIDRLVSELTSEELQKIDVGTWFDRRQLPHQTNYAGEKLPTLSQVFDLFRQNNALLHLEMKCGPSEADSLATAVSNLISGSSILDRVIVESFDLSATAVVKKIDPRIRTAALFEPKFSRPVSTVLRMKMVDLAVACGADEIALHHSLASHRLLEKARRAGLSIVIWTVDSAQWVERALSLGVKALITNDPEKMVRHRDAERRNKL